VARPDASRGALCNLEKASAKELIIHSIPMLEHEGSANIPTVIFYESAALNARVYIGAPALAAAGGRARVTQDFKVDLGNVAPGRRPRNTIRTATAGEKTATELSGDFLYKVVKLIRDWMAENDLSESPAVLVAEPLSI
jgi:hypothetical protein